MQKCGKLSYYSPSASIVLTRTLQPDEEMVKKRFPQTCKINLHLQNRFNNLEGKTPEDWLDHEFQRMLHSLDHIY